MKKKIIILVNELSFLISHRLEIVTTAKKKGYNVKVIYGELGGVNSDVLSREGIDCIQLPLKRGSFNPLRELWSLYSIIKTFNRIKPNIVHLITTKSILYGGIAARIVKIPCVVTAIAGLGSFFHKRNIRNFFFQKLLFPIFYLAFNHPNQCVIVQNLEDKKILVDWGVLNEKKVFLIKGSGVNLVEFKNFEEQKNVFTVCYASRLLRDKGVLDFVSAAKILKKRGLKIKFLLAGSLDSSNSTSLTELELQNIIKEKVVEVLGFQHDIPSLYSRSNIVCLPSYFGEGIPKALIQAAAACRAVVTTDHPGCRDAIIPNKTGLLVPIKSPRILADKIKWLMDNPKARVAMGKAGRLLAESEFPVEKIVKRHLNIYQNLLEKSYQKN